MKLNPRTMTDAQHSAFAAEIYRLSLEINKTRNRALEAVGSAN